MTGRLRRRPVRATGTLLACGLLSATPSPAAAQAWRAAAARRVEIGIGGGIGGGLTLGERDATLRANSASPSPFRLFSAETRLDPSALAEVRLGYRLTPHLTIEAAAAVARPTLTTSLSGDAESAAAVDATTRLTEYVIAGGGLWRFSTNTQRRWTPFVSGGAGVARHVHEGRTLVESALDGYVGGGLIYPLGSPRVATRRAGLRLDGRLHVLSGGVADGQGMSPRGVVSGSIFVTF